MKPMLKRTAWMLLFLLGAGAAVSAQSFEAPDSALIVAHPEREYYQPFEHYNFGNFFDQLDLPTCLGVSYTPNRMESVGFYAKMSVEWRQRKNFGWFAAVGMDTHSCTYDDVQMRTYKGEPINVTSGEIWYYDINLGAGYRLPIVKDLAAFYEHPYFSNFNVSLLVQPGITIPYVKQVTQVYLNENGDVRYKTEDRYNSAPSLRLTAAFEWFVMPKFAISVEAAYIQHLLPTMLEKAYYNYDVNPKPLYAGPLVFNIGLTGFFN